MTYHYTVPYNTSMATIWAHINHDHEGTTAKATLYRLSGSTEVLLGDSGIDIEQPVNLDVGDNYFFIEVEAELGNTRRYLIHIFRAGAELDLEWVRVNGQRAAKEGMI